MIVIIDYGMGNLGSVVNMFKRIGAEAKISGEKSVIEDASKLLLPGVGSFDKAMEKINDLNLKEVLDRQAFEYKKPIMGICLGMQLLTRGSEEGSLPGLGWIPADTIKFPSIANLRIPHMGWNSVKPSTPSILTANLPYESRFYFVHSYCVHVDNEVNSILKCSYGVEFDAAVQMENIYGAQFHPEKSHKFGMQLLKNFSKLTC
jgi:glutamine amidotransferase